MNLHSGLDLASMAIRKSTQAPTRHMSPYENGSGDRVISPSVSNSRTDLQALSYHSEHEDDPKQMSLKDRSAPNQPWLCNVEPSSLNPPITKASLSELDDCRLANNVLLHHDLNFDVVIQYRPTPRIHCEQRSSLAYWNAMQTEIEGWFMDQDNRSLCQSSDNCCWSRSLVSEDGRLPREKLPRLTRMFETIREILKSLLPTCEWAAIDSRLDIDLLLQEIENGVCNFIGLSEWFSRVFQDFCLPERDRLVDEMVSTIHSGVRKMDIGIIVTGLRRLFGILEVMKLDIANTKIRCLRPVMVDSIVSFEQKEFLGWISDGWDPSQAKAWFTHEQQTRSPARGVLRIAPAVTDMIISNAKTLPPTFTLDYTRLQILQTHFERLMHHASCCWAFEEVVYSLGWHGTIRKSTYNDLFARISIITSDPESRCNPHQQTSDIALEIVRAAYGLCNIVRLPSQVDVELSEYSLDYACDVTTGVYRDLHAYLAEDLRDSVQEEVESIKDLTPMQISNRYTPSASIRSLQQDNTPQTELLRMAQLIAHISVLHWRVWGPILYELPDASNDD